MKQFALLFLLVATARADTLLVLNKTDATLAFVDPAKLVVVAKIPTGEGPHEVATDGHIALVANYGTRANPGTTLSIVDLATRKEKERRALHGLTRPHGTYAIGSHLYLTAEGSPTVARYEVPT